jgi:hypothetical protein
MEMEMNCMKIYLKLSAILFFLLSGVSVSTGSPGISKSKRAYYIKLITNKYPNQLTNPQKKTRKTFSQFGYGLYEFPVPVFPISKFIEPGKFGYQSYGKPDRETEKNGALYTCSGGFIDVSHMRAAVDWTVYLTFKLIVDTTDFDLPWEAGRLSLHFKNIGQLTINDIARMAQKIAFERLVWHEVASWHYHKPYHKFSEQSSTFTPEDTYSNMLGTMIGKNVALRLLKDTTSRSYSDITTEEIQKTISSLQPLSTKKESKRAYDIVDLDKQRKLPEGQRNTDVWYDSKIVFHDQRYVFKRYMNIGPEISPWLVPGSEQLGCSSYQAPYTLEVPQFTHDGNSFYKYYEFRITPDANMFYNHKKNRQLHPPFGAFTTQHYDKIMAQIDKEMAQVLLPDFDKRDNVDPTIYYSHVHKVFLK